VVLFGKYKRRAGSIRVEGQVPGGTWRRSIAVSGATSDNHSALPYLWARHRIRRLADMNLLAANDARIKEVTALGLKYHLLTEYTSFVAVDEVVRKNGKKKRTVRQPLPLPAGVSDSAVGESFGSGGLGIRGTGRGGGGVGYGTIGLGNLNTIGHGGGGGSGAGYGRGSGGRAAAPAIRAGAAMVKGSLGRQPIRRTIQRQINAVRACYERQLQSNPNLAGKVVVKFVIDGTGKVTSAVIAETTLNNPAVEQCLLKVFKRMTFPQPEGGGVVVVNYPFIFKSQ
jgi:TonB family protein